MLAGMCNMKKEPIGIDSVKKLEFISKKAKIKQMDKKKILNKLQMNLEKMKS